MLKSERLVAITLLLQARGKMTAERLSDILGVSTRTIYRDMDTLSLAHVPVTMDYGPGGGYYLPDAYHLDSATFTSEEAVALALGGAMAGGYRLFENGDGLRRALFKLEAALPEEFRADVRAARERILFDTTSWYQRPIVTPHLETVRAAVWAGRQLDLVYPRSDGSGVQQRRVEPQGLVCKADTWYLVAYCQMRRDFRTFRVSRIEDVTVREEAVSPRPEFDLQAYWAEARQRFEELSLPFRLIMKVSPAALRRMPDAVVVERHGLGGNMVVRVDLESEHAAISYALSFGPEIEVLDPAAVREAVLAAARAVALVYEGVDATAPRLQ